VLYVAIEGPAQLIIMYGHGADGALWTYGDEKTCSVNAQLGTIKTWVWRLDSQFVRDEVTA